jgi:2-polyprenyl-6-methoxyphenol hydroxylase-like FAD-dependent oxidoreductase
MKIAIVGAGPTGLYAAGLLKQLYPDASVCVYDKRSAGQVSGFGYTIHGQSLSLLGILSPDVANTVMRQGSEPFTRRTITIRNRGVELNPDVGRNLPIIGVEYDTLLDVLRARATGAGVEFHHGVVITDLDGLARDHDLVLLANGANTAFLDRFEPLQVNTGLSYAWGKAEETSNEMAMGFDTCGEIPWVCHRYPISKKSTAMIFEVLNEQAAEASQLLMQTSRTSQYFPDGVTFRQIPLCLCRKRARGNMVCIGDAALAQYFAAGAGLYFGLMQMGLLYHHLDSNQGSIEQKLQAYDAKATEYFKYQWGPNKALIRKKQKLLAGFAGMRDEAILAAMVADG